MSRATAARLAVLALVWGSSFLLIKLALEGLTPIQVVLGRLVAGAGVLGVIVRLRRQPLPRTAALWGHLALMGIVANIVPFFLFAWGEQRISSGLAGVLNGTTPLFTLAIAMGALPEERLSAQRAGGLLLGFAGVVLVVGPGLGPEGADGLLGSVPGQLACLAAAACYGVAFVYTRRFLAGSGFPPLALSACQLGAASAMLAVLAPVVARTPVQLTLSVVASVAVLGAVGTGLAYLLFYRLIGDAGATTVSMVTYLLPVVAVILGIIVLGEPLTWNVFAGAAVVIVGVALAEGRLRPARQPAVSRS